VRDQIRVLIVDDEVVIREMLAQHLTDEEFDVVTASSGEEALKIFREDPNHLVVTDIRMGGMSGIELLENIKELDKEAVVIIITSHASLDNAVATLKAGAFDYIFKPFEDLDVITQVIHRGLERIQMLHENRQLIENLEENNQIIERANEELKELVIRDGLTNLFNHRYFMEVLDKEMDRAVRYERALCLIMLDVDNFKEFNDTHGHPAGDGVLKIIADLFDSRLRSVDIPARYGGEEFSIILPETDLKGGRIVADEIRAMVENYPFEGRETQPLGKITISAGVAEFSDYAEESSVFLKRADDALYRAKGEGRNQVISVDSS